MRKRGAYSHARSLLKHQHSNNVMHAISTLLGIRAFLHPNTGIHIYPTLLQIKDNLAQKVN